MVMLTVVFSPRTSGFMIACGGLAGLGFLRLHLLCRREPAISHLAGRLPRPLPPNRG